jgi:hypothetical protein
MGEEVGQPGGRTPGEGTELLARLTGRDAAEMKADQRKLAGGLFALGSEAASLLRGYASEDPAVREAAYRRWAELDSMLPKPAPPGRNREAGLSEANRERLRVGLTKIVDALRDIEQSVSEPSNDGRATREP